MDFEELMQQFLDMDDDIRVDLARETVEVMRNYLEENYGVTSAHHLVSLMFSVFCCVDGSIDYKEYEFFKVTTGVECSFENFCESMQNGGNQHQIDELFDEISDENKAFMQDVFTLAVCVFTSNGTLTVSEQCFLEEYFLSN